MVVSYWLYNNGPQEAEAENDISRNWWLYLVTIQSKVAQSRNTFVDRVVTVINGNWTDIGATDACKSRNRGKGFYLINVLQKFFMFL